VQWGRLAHRTVEMEASAAAARSGRATAWQGKRGAGGTARCAHPGLPQYSILWRRAATRSSKKFNCWFLPPSACRKGTPRCCTGGEGHCAVLQIPYFMYCIDGQEYVAANRAGGLSASGGQLVPESALWKPPASVKVGHCPCLVASWAVGLRAAAPGFCCMHAVGGSNASWVLCVVLAWEGIESVRFVSCGLGGGRLPHVSLRCLAPRVSASHDALT
jgi:hypothetical protein